MTTTVRPERTASSGTPDPGPGRAARLRWLATARDALDRPLTAYYLLLGASGLLLTIGLVMVLSASSVYSFQTQGDSYAVVKRQLLWVAVGLPAAWVASRLPLRLIRNLTYPALGVALVLLLLTVFIGKQVNGNQNWLGVGSLAIQPSEIAKLAIVLWAAHVFAVKERRLGDLMHLIVPVVPGFLAATGLVMAGRDLGTTLVFATILVGLLFVVGAPRRFFTIGILAIGAVVLSFAALDAERMARLTNFVDPFKDYHDTGWQPAHGLYALSSGGWFGEGIGASQQKWGDLPEAHTDFIFAVLGEELGLVGTLLVVVLFLTIAYAALRLARETADPFVRYASFGIVVWLVGQMMINVGMVLALLPVIGIPLPLISYGGSSLLPSLVALGLLVGFARREPGAARALAQRKRSRSAGLSAGRSGSTNP
ncbi:putative lipid II flippase FtsW [Nocardioides pantholopis]|uniref:putative lipid II flippase FtsW n=1 Tax=Nocardioides pantholopis TaxID=2483798 RepID=UPI001F496480|nr:putative lipid II flippase FtsW [Nocardioides pantholopis]